MRLWRISLLMLVFSSVSCASDSDSDSDSGAPRGQAALDQYPFNFTTACIRALVREKLLICEEETYYQLGFQFSKHPQVSTYQLTFYDVVNLGVDVGRRYACFFDRTSDELDLLVASRNGDRTTREVRPHQWSYYDFTDEQWEEFTLGPEWYVLDFRVSEELWVGACNGEEVSGSK